MYSGRRQQSGARLSGGSPVFVERASGSHIYDVDGNAYIDYVCSWGPCILGHAYLRVIKAVQAACENGLTYGAPTGKELKLAELIRSVPVSRRWKCPDW